jgi:hypothetical protein
MTETPLNNHEQGTLAPITLKIEDKFEGTGAKPGVTKFMRAKVSDEGNEIGDIDFIMNSKTNEMYVSGVDFGANAGKGYGSRAYITLARQYPEYKFFSSGDFFKQPDGSRLGVKLWEKLERLGYASIVEEGKWVLDRFNLNEQSY